MSLPIQLNSKLNVEMLPVFASKDSLPANLAPYVSGPLGFDQPACRHSAGVLSTGTRCNLCKYRFPLRFSAKRRGSRPTPSGPSEDLQPLGHSSSTGSPP